MKLPSPQEALVLKELFSRYRDATIPMFEQNDSTRNKCSSSSLMKLCDEAIANVEHYPSDKMHRWLGFVQGVLAAQGIIDVDTERDYTRPLFHSLYGEPVATFNSAEN